MLLICPFKSQIICWKMLSTNWSNSVLETSKNNKLELNTTIILCAMSVNGNAIAFINYILHFNCSLFISPDAEDGNEMVFCEICNICVHQVIFLICLKSFFIYNLFLGLLWNSRSTSRRLALQFLQRFGCVCNCFYFIFV